MMAMPLSEVTNIKNLTLEDQIEPLLQSNDKQEVTNIKNLTLDDQIEPLLQSNEKQEVTDIKNLTLDDQIEPLLQSNDKRFVLFPIQCDDIYEAYKHTMGKFWMSDKLQLEHCSLASLSVNGQESIQRVLSFWAAFSEQTFLFQLNKEIEMSEARCFFGYQMNSQINHRDLFARLVNLGQYRHSEDKKKGYLEKFFQQEPFAVRILAYSAMQSILTTSVRIVQFLLKDDPEAADLTKSLSLFLNDKDDYAAFGATLFNRIVQKPSETKFQSVVEGFVTLETEFLATIFQLPINGLDDVKIADFVKEQANKVCELFKYNKMFQVDKKKE